MEFEPSNFELSRGEEGEVTITFKKIKKQGYTIYERKMK